MYSNYILGPFAVLIIGSPFFYLSIKAFKLICPTYPREYNILGALFVSAGGIVLIWIFLAFIGLTFHLISWFQEMLENKLLFYFADLYLMGACYVSICKKKWYMKY